MVRTFFAGALGLARRAGRGPDGAVERVALPRARTFSLAVGRLSIR
jgi:hypothetical protein